MFDKLFGRSKKKDEPQVDIPFGRYSDNNKQLSKVNRWSDADNLFKEKKYPEGLDAFFDYLRDDEAGNVTYERNGTTGKFLFYQGSRIVRGEFTGEQLKAEVTLARMPQPSVPVMRRLLEMNFSLYYSRFALDNDRLCMRFDSPVPAASPSKLYYGLKELSTKADKQDDLLVQDFASLETIDNEHIKMVPDAEKQIKFDFLQHWLKESLDMIGSLDMDKFSGGIAYMLLSMVYRLDYLITPEGKLLNDLEKIAGIYFKKDERPVAEKNRDMIAEFKKIQEKSKEEIFSYLFRSKYTFAIVAPQQFKTVADSIHGANQSMVWYRDNGYPFIANQVIEYGFSYCQYSYSLPKAISELFRLYMHVNYGTYFTALGFRENYFDVTTSAFNQNQIVEKIKQIQEKWKEKYPSMDFKTQNLRFDTLVNFNQTFTTEMEFLNMDSK